MDFVISNVTTVAEEEEPLYEIKKVAVIGARPKSEVRKKYSKSCYVPLCPNSTKATPEKMFITLPVNPERREKWFRVVGKSTEGKNPKSPMFCCEDHFDLEKDMKNYEEHLQRGKVQMVLHRSVVPHVFVCNQYGHLKRKERVEVLQTLHEKHISETVAEEEEYGIERQGRRIKKRKLNDVEFSTNSTVFVGMPDIEFEDEPDYIEICKSVDVIDTIVIEDSDPDEH